MPQPAALPRPVASLSELSPRYDALFVDLWGCLHDGYRPFEAAVRALRAYRAGGGCVMLLTNSPRPRPAVQAQLDAIGVPRDCYDAITSSGDASRAALAAGLVGTRVCHLGPKRDEPFFDDLGDGIDVSRIRRVPLDEAEGIVCTGLFDDHAETPEDYRARLLYARTRGMKLLCTNPDLMVDYGSRRVYCAGAIARLYEEMGGESLYFGKPHPPIYDLARNRLSALRNVPDSRMLCIGDGISTDIRGGLAEGLDTLFITGGLDGARFGEDPEHPDPGALAAFFAERQISPTYTAPALR